MDTHLKTVTAVLAVAVITAVAVAIIVVAVAVAVAVTIVVERASDGALEGDDAVADAGGKVGGVW